RHVASDHLSVDMLDANARATPLEPAPPAIQPCLCVCHRLRTETSGPVLFDICIQQPIPSPHRRPPKRHRGRTHVRPPNVPEINNMTSNMTSLEAAMSPELN